MEFFLLFRRFIQKMRHWEMSWILAERRHCCTVYCVRIWRRGGGVTMTTTNGDECVPMLYRHTVAIQMPHRGGEGGGGEANAATKYRQRRAEYRSRIAAHAHSLYATVFLARIGARRKYGKLGNFTSSCLEFCLFSLQSNTHQFPSVLSTHIRTTHTHTYTAHTHARYTHIRYSF